MAPVKRWLPSLVVLALAVLVPFVVPPYVLHLAIMVGIFSILSLSLNILSGYTGQFSIGHAGFWAVGAYASALLSVKLGWSVWLALPAAGVVAMVCGAIIGIPAIRVTGTYLAVVTIAFGVIVQTLAYNLERLTGGAHGIYAIPRPVLGSLQFRSREEYYFLVLAVLVVLIFVALRLMGSFVGRAFIALREDEVAARAMGINVTYYRVASFVLSAFFAGLAGGLYAHYSRFINHDAFNMDVSIEILMMIIVGGLASIPGSILGAAVIYLLPEALRFLGHAYYMVFGALVIVMLLFVPNGLIDPVTRSFRWLSRLFSGVKHSDSAAASGRN